MSSSRSDGRNDFEGVVVAAGRAARFGGATPKQFLDLDGRPVLEHSVRLLADRAAVRSVVVVLPPAEAQGPRAEGVRSWPGVSAVVAGGETRAQSVACGVDATSEAPFVLVHDAARPLASAALVEAVIAGTREHGAAVPLAPLDDTVKRIDPAGFVAQTVDREELRRAQTPQGARRDWLCSALAKAQGEGRVYTDESAALESDGRRVAGVCGEAGNVKITTPADLHRARCELSGGSDMRVGTGFDVHRFGGDGPLVLGGVVFEGEPGLDGHSDADVVLHAAMDALLGAAALGDIGVHFPPGDEKWAGAASSGLAETVASMIRERGFEIVNLDLTLLAERPKISARADTMREAIARSLGIETSQVGLKATTAEKLGALGRGEGIACQAACLLDRRERP